MRHFDNDFLFFFSFFQSDFFRNGFQYSLLVRSGSSCLFSQWKCFQLYVRTCPAMFFLFRFLLRPYDVTATSNLLFVHCSCNFNWSACVTSFLLLVERVFCSIRVIKFLVTLDLPHSQKWLPDWNWLLFTLIQRDKVKWVCVTLNEGYLRAANRGSKNLYRFLFKI